MSKANSKAHKKKPQSTQLKATNSKETSSKIQGERPTSTHLDSKFRSQTHASTLHNSYTAMHLQILAPNHTHINAQKFKFTIPSINNSYLKVTTIAHSSRVGWWKGNDGWGQWNRLWRRCMSNEGDAMGKLKWRQEAGATKVGLLHDSRGRFKIH